MLTPAELGLTTANEDLRRRVEDTIAVHGSCGQPWLDDGMRPLLSRPGKRLRPALVLAAASCGVSPDTDQLVMCAAAVELMHLSSLVHDDLMDSASSRCGLPTLHVTHGLTAAMLGGDHLVSAGGGLAARVSADAALAWQQGYVDLCDGQIRETANRYRLDTPIREYLAAIGGKTGALMRTSCQLGGLCAGLSDEQVAGLATFGDAFGVLFQLVDDLMDVVSTEELWTKPVELDLPNGVYSAAALAVLDDPRSPLRALLGPDMSQDDVTAAYECVRRNGVPVARALIHEFTSRAEQALAVLPDTPARARLEAMPRTYVTRVLEHQVAPAHRRWLRPDSVPLAAG